MNTADVTRDMPIPDHILEGNKHRALSAEAMASLLDAIHAGTRAQKSNLSAAQAEAPSD